MKLLLHAVFLFSLAVIPVFTQRAYAEAGGPSPLGREGLDLAKPLVIPKIRIDPHGQTDPEAPPRPGTPGPGEPGAQPGGPTTPVCGPPPACTPLCRYLGKC
jgi:hypothetical protein